MITIRPATIEDVAILQKLNQQVFIDNQKYDRDLDMTRPLSDKSQEYYNNLLNNKNSVCFIAFNDKKPIGYIACNIKIYSYRKSKYCEIENMGVNSDYQSRGIGSLLINKAKIWARDHGFQKIYVSSYFQNIKAIKFYQNNGFTEIDIGLEMTL